MYFQSFSLGIVGCRDGFGEDGRQLGIEQGRADAVSAGDQQGYVLYLLCTGDLQRRIINCLDYGGDRHKMRLKMVFNVLFHSIVGGG